MSNPIKKVYINRKTSVMDRINYKKPKKMKIFKKKSPFKPQIDLMDGNIKK